MKEEKKITVRQAAIQDYEAIKNILISAFGDVEEALLVEKLRHIDTFIPHLSLVALMENRIVGYILFTKILIVDKEKKNESLALAPMAVLPQNQRIGIGSQLIKVGLQKAAKLGYTSVIVWGHKEYYPKFGFQPALLYGIICPLPDKQEYLMALSLKPNGLKNIKGMVLYPKEFGL